MNCPNCGLSLDANFSGPCPRCGQPLSDTLDHAQGHEQAPLGPTQPVSPGSFAGDSPSPFSQPDQQESGSQPVQTAFPAPAPSQWMKPSIAPAYSQPIRKRSRKRRNLVALGVIICIVAACALYGYFAFSGPKNAPTSSNPIPETNVLFSDPLTSDTTGWSTDTSHCLFQDSAYHVKNAIVCFAPAGNIADANITVQAKQVAGPLIDGYGISFRHTSSGNRYDFEINSNSQWAVFKIVNNAVSTLISSTPNAAIKGGLNTINSLRVEMKGTHFVFFVNDTQVGEVDDTTFASGQVGLAVSGADTEVAYTDFEITKVD